MFFLKHFKLQILLVIPNYPTIPVKQQQIYAFDQLI